MSVSLSRRRSWSCARGCFFWRLVLGGGKEASYPRQVSVLRGGAGRRPGRVKQAVAHRVSRVLHGTLDLAASIGCWPPASRVRGGAALPPNPLSTERRAPRPTLGAPPFQRRWRSRQPAWPRHGHQPAPHPCRPPTAPPWEEEGGGGIHRCLQPLPPDTHALPCTPSLTAPPRAALGFACWCACPGELRQQRPWAASARSGRRRRVVLWRWGAEGAGGTREARSDGGFQGRAFLASPWAGPRCMCSPVVPAAPRGA